jgi:hypothetical protein
MRHKGRQSLGVLTVNGRVHLRRVRWWTPGDVRTPIDALLDQAEKTFTRGVREMLCRLNQCSSSFDRTAENLERLATLKISGETTRQIVEHEGALVADLMRRGRLDYGWTAKECKVPENPSKTRVYMGCDGVKAPMVTEAEKRKRRAKTKAKRRRCGRKRRPLPPRKAGADQSFKELRVVALYDETQARRAVAVTRGDCEATGRLLRALTDRLGTECADETIANIDGAPWILNQIEFHRAAKAVNLDYYHLKDYAQRTRREIFGEGTPEGQEWLTRFVYHVMEQGVDATLNFLHEQRRSLRGRRRSAVDALIGYVSERRAIIQCKEFRAKGWQIGSGPTEAQCKSTTLRIKGRGRRWNVENAEALMALAALTASHRWPHWWTKAA